MSFLAALPIIGKLFSKVTGLISEVVVDKDKRNEILGDIEMLRQQVYMAELGTKTVPWVDALHKMGRQMLLYMTIGIVGYCVYNNIEIDQNLLFLLGGPQAVYHFIKGKGK